MQGEMIQNLRFQLFLKVFRCLDFSMANVDFSIVTMQSHRHWGENLLFSYSAFCYFY